MKIPNDSPRAKRRDDMPPKFALFVGDNGRRKVYPLLDGMTAPEYVDCADGTRLPLVMTARYDADTQHVSASVLTQTGAA